MLVISEYKLKQMNYIIPNINRIEGMRIHVENNITTYFYNDEVLLSVYETSDFYYSQYEFNKSVAFKTGLFEKTPYNIQNVLDTLYYTANPYDLKLSKKSPEQLRKVYNRLSTRLAKSHVSNRSCFTTKVINEIIDFNCSSIPKPTQESSLDDISEYIRNVKNYYHEYFMIRINFDYVDLKWKDKGSLDSFTTRVDTIYASDPDKLKLKFNLAVAPSRYAYNTSLYCIDTEFIHDGRIYLIAEHSVVQCPVCNANALDSSVSEDGCPTCLVGLTKIHSYSTRVPELLKFKAKKVTPNTLYLGAELEYESKSSKENDTVYANRSLKNHAILKSDGSIHNGFEIVTCPATLDIHLEEFQRFFKYLGNTSLKGESNTGMHVHISRKPLSMLTVGKMTAFLNASTNKNFIESIAGRKLNTYCQQDDSRTVSYPLVYGTGARYNILNLNNKDTVEIRMFSTPDSYENFAYKMEFAEALAIYCSPCTANHSVYKLLDFSNFISWANGMKKSYPNLVNKLKTI
jgi:hypothetical protein